MSSNQAEPRQDEISPMRQALPQIMAVSVKNVLLLVFGMTLGFPTILIPNISGNDPNEKIHLEQEAVSWISSINLICLPLGCLISGTLTEVIGRKRGMQIANIPILTAWILLHFSDQTWQIFLAMCLAGFAGGLMEAPTLTYVAEITQPHLRGTLASTSSMSVTFGALTQFIMGAFLDWRSVTLINCIFPVLSIILLVFVPETPIWLITKHRLEEAKKSIAWLRGWTMIEAIEYEYQELHKQIMARSKPDATGENSPKFKAISKIELLRRLMHKSFLWPFSLVSLAFFLSHFNGNATLTVYSIKIFETLKVPIDKYYATVIMGSVQLLGCVVCMSFIHAYGKRIINFISLMGVATCFLIVATYAYITGIRHFDDKVLTNSTNSTVNTTTVDLEEAHHWIPVVFLVISAFLNYMGIRILPWILIGEVYSNETRAAASGISGASGYIFGFISNKIFLGLVATLTLPGVFWFYSCIGFLGTIVMYFLLPETEGKTLFEITEHFEGKERLSNSVRRHKLSNGTSNPAFVQDEKSKDVESRL